MEAFGIVILSILAFFGVYLTIAEFLRVKKVKPYDAGFKLVLVVPKNGKESLEGIVRALFQDDILNLTDEKLYLALTDNDYETNRIISDLKGMYPLEVLPDTDRYCMITNRMIEKFKT